MLDSFIDWFKVNSTEVAIRVAIVLVFSAMGFAIFNLVDVVKKPPEVKEIKGSIQNHLTWSVKGECYFVQPYSNGTVYLIRVEDCDKDIKK
jgi:hypothetical protein